MNTVIKASHIEFSSLYPVLLRKKIWPTSNLIVLTASFCLEDIFNIYFIAQKLRLRWARHLFNIIKVNRSRQKGSPVLPCHSENCMRCPPHTQALFHLLTGLAAITH